MWYPFRNFLYLSPDDGAGDGAAASEPTAEPAAEAAPADPATAPQAAQEPAASAPEQTVTAAGSKPATKPDEAQLPDAAAQLAAANQRALQAELRGAAAIAGVAKERIPYVLRLADTSGIDLSAADAETKIAAAIDKVLGDLPELRGGAVGTGSAGNFARKPASAEDPEIARIHRNILGE